MFSTLFPLNCPLLKTAPEHSLGHFSPLSTALMTVMMTVLN